VEVEAAEAAAPSMLGAWAEAVAGPDGGFLLQGLPDRAVALFVSAEGHHARILSGLEAREDATAPPVTVELGAVADGETPQVELAGIGAVLSARGRGGVRIASVLPGSGAAEAGLAAGDEVLAVDGRSVAELGGLSGAVERIRGPENTRVVLTVRRGEAAPSEVWVWRRVVRG
jgi:S1-C subfamily serine protease